ncbi:MBL fold metallo-hydrolase [Aquincola sp. MAHUQ-54]|uniref:MBL fold metallo-hydrolase n=2 Tax=Sphaerotilaceae TaxID=2975441 RepID=A0AAW9QAZ0_9BURK
MRFHRLAAALAFGAALTGGAAAQTPSIPTFPNAIHADVAEHLNQARIIAGKENRQHFYRACIYSQVYPMYAASAQAPYLMPPIQVFDQVYWVGQGAISAWVVKTSAGLVVIDSLNNASQAQTILVAGMVKLGLNPADIKYVLLTNENADHIGGAKYLQETYGAKVMASAPAWAAMASAAGAPMQDIVLYDGQRSTIGDVTFDFTLTPGVTAGALTAIFPVSDKGTRRMAAFHSGLAIPDSAEGKMTQIDSLAKFATVSQAAGVNVLMSAYGSEDLSVYGHDLLRHRRAFSRAPKSAADFQDPHPYVMAASGQYQRFLQIISECTRVAAARNGQVLPR